MNIDYLISILREMGYNIKGIRHAAGTSEKTLPERSAIYVDGHHPKLEMYGYVRMIKGMWQNPETEITILPSEVFLG